MNNLVFVYGTLKRGCGNHGCLTDQEFIGRAKIEKGHTLYDCGRGFPFLVSDGGVGCAGELYRVTDDALRVLDRLEGHPAFYERKKRNIIKENGKRLKAWVYIFPQKPSDRARIIEDWGKD